jgi:hypothetical protein
MLVVCSCSPGCSRGIEHVVDEILTLDATSLLVAEYLALRYEGAPDRVRVDFAAVGRIVREWFPVRAIAMEAAPATASLEDIDGHAALALADSLGAPLVTTSEQLRSHTVPVLRC